MSRTNSKARKEKNPTEFYPTPAECTEALLRAEELPRPSEKKFDYWLEPCAGKGAIIKAANDYWKAKGIDIPQWTANEIDPRHREDILTIRPTVSNLFWEDARAFSSSRFRPEFWDVAITNPPFSLAGEIWAALRPLATYTALLLPTGFLGAAKRYKWLSQDMPDLGILTPRPQFTNQGSDSATYGWFIWGPDRKKEGKLFLLPCRDELTRDDQPELFAEAA